MRPCLQLAPLFSLLACTQAAEGPRDAGARLDGEARLDSGFLPDAGTVNPCDGVTCRATDECMDGRCVDVLCLGIVCPGESICFMGACYLRACGDVACTRGEACLDGACRELACEGVACPANTACLAGGCVPTQCDGRPCQDGEVCVGGACIAAGCLGVICPTGLACSSGVCSDCPAGEYRDESACVPRRPLGEPCADSVACASGLCVDGRCCSSPCLGECRACNASGQCVLAAKGTPDPACGLLACGAYGGCTEAAATPDAGTDAGGCTPELCNGLDDDCDGLVDEGREICNGLDDDCDGYVDESPSCGGPRMDLAEQAQYSWAVFDSDSGTPLPCEPSLPNTHGTLLSSFSASNVLVGGSSMQVDLSYPGAGDFGAVYPRLRNASWDLSTTTGLTFEGKAVLPSGITWQRNAPEIILCGAQGYRKLTPSASVLGAGSFTRQNVPLTGGSGWTVTDVGGFSLGDVRGVEFHLDPARGVSTGTVTVLFDDVRFY